MSESLTFFIIFWSDVIWVFLSKYFGREGDVSRINETIKITFWIKLLILIIFTERLSSTNPCSILYQGPEAGSELEVKFLSSYLLRMRPQINAFISLHNFHQAILTRWGYTKEQHPEHDTLVIAHFDSYNQFSNLSIKVIKLTNPTQAPHYFSYVCHCLHFSAEIVHEIRFFSKHFKKKCSTKHLSNYLQIQAHVY